MTTSKLLSANGSFSQSPATKRTPSSFFSLLSLSSFLTGLCPYYSLSVIATPFPRPVIRHFIFFMCPNHFFQKPLRLFHRPASRFCFFPPPFTVIFNAVSLLKYQHNKPAVIAAITTYASDTAPLFTSTCFHVFTYGIPFSSGMAQNLLCPTQSLSITMPSYQFITSRNKSDCQYADGKSCARFHSPMNRNSEANIIRRNGIIKHLFVLRHIKSSGSVHFTDQLFFSSNL